MADGKCLKVFQLVTVAVKIMQAQYMYVLRPVSRCYRRIFSSAIVKPPSVEKNSAKPCINAVFTLPPKIKAASQNQLSLSVLHNRPHITEDHQTSLLQLRVSLLNCAMKLYAELCCSYKLGDYSATLVKALARTLN